MNRVFISDLHLDAERPEKINLFESTLLVESERNDEIYILGDLVESWIGDDDYSRFPNRLRHCLAKCTDRCALYLMHGNRDLLIGQTFAEEVGATLLPDPTILIVGTDRFLLTHGDTFCTDDIPYQRLRKLLHSEDWQKDFLSRPFQERRKFAQLVRNQSESAKVSKAENIMDVVLKSVLQAMDQHQCNYLIHGHTHRPRIHRIDDLHTRYVLGDWNKCGWLLRMPPQVTLECFSIASATAE